MPQKLDDMLSHLLTQKSGNFFITQNTNMKRIAIQGAKGSFHDITAHRYFSGEDIEVIYCARFEDIFSIIKKDDSVIGLMAIENTIAGSLLQNHELLRDCLLYTSPSPRDTR